MAALKTHVALNVTDIEKSITFYQAMFGITPIKHKVDYAKFDIANPPLNLTLNLAEQVHKGGALSHLGVQVSSSQDVQDAICASQQRFAIARFQAAGLATFEEKDTDCCYALQDKVWVTDPDGNRWEIFVVKVGDTTPEQNLMVSVNSDTEAVVAKRPCCA